MTLLKTKVNCSHDYACSDLDDSCPVTNLLTSRFRIDSVPRPQHVRRMENAAMSVLRDQAAPTSERWVALSLRRFCFEASPADSAGRHAEIEIMNQYNLRKLAERKNTDTEKPASPI